MFQNSSATLDFGGRENDYEAKLQLAPVVDLVLFLIWFYLLVGHFVVSQKDADVELPVMASPAASKELPAEVVINLRADDKVIIAGKEYAGAALIAAIRQEMTKAQAGGQGLRVVVRADRRQSFAKLDEVLRYCRVAGVRQIVFRAEEGGSL
jgi:biopolymer transport protein ExbD